MSEVWEPVDPDELKRQRNRARALRDSPWWKRRISTGICYYCRRRVGHTALTMDHIVPLGRGGTCSGRARPVSGGGIGTSGRRSDRGSALGCDG